MPARQQRPRQRLDCLPVKWLPSPAAFRLPAMKCDSAQTSSKRFSFSAHTAG